MTKQDLQNICKTIFYLILSQAKLDSSLVLYKIKLRSQLKKIDSNLVFLRPQNPSNVCPNTIDLSDLIEKSPCTRNFIEDNHTKFGLLKQGIQALEENGDLVDKAFPTFWKQA